MIEKYKTDLVDLAIEVRDIVQNHMTTETTRVCELCGAPDVTVEVIESDTAVEHYVEDCPDDRCDGVVSFYHLYVSVGSLVIVERRDFKSVECTGADCDPGKMSVRDIPSEVEPFERTEFELPIEAVINTNIHEHHTNYVPEETISVCSHCHGKIHHNDDFRLDLRPEMARNEWERLIRDE